MPRVDKRELGAIFVGCMLGAVLRVWIGNQLAPTATRWPCAVFIININGSAALAYFATRFQERLPQSTYRRPFLGTGFCGADTAFSTLEVEILEMLDHDPFGLALGYALASLTAGYIAVWATTASVRRSRQP